MIESLFTVYSIDAESSQLWADVPGVTDIWGPPPINNFQAYELPTNNVMPQLTVVPNHLSEVSLGI